MLYFSLQNRFQCNHSGIETCVSFNVESIIQIPQAPRNVQNFHTLGMRCFS